MITAFGAYKVYLGLKTHFTTKKYNVALQSIGGIPKVKASPESFEARKDKVIFERIAYKYGDDTKSYFTAMFICGKSDIWDIGANHAFYLEYKGRNEALLRTVSTDLLKYKGKPLSEVLKFRGNHPVLLIDWISGKISPEAIVLLHQKYDLFTEWDCNMMDDPVWKKVGLILKKYALLVSPANIEDIFAVFDNYFTQD